MTNPQWGIAIQKLCELSADELGFKGIALQPILSKVAVYGAGGRRVVQQDAYEHDRVVAKLVVQLPSEYTGGDMLVSGAGMNGLRCYDFGNVDDTAAFKPHYAVYAADAFCAVKEVTSGYRLVVEYSLYLPSELVVINGELGDHTLVDMFVKKYFIRLYDKIKLIPALAELVRTFSWGTVGASIVCGIDGLLYDILMKLALLLADELKDCQVAQAALTKYGLKKLKGVAVITPSVFAASPDLGLLWKNAMAFEDPQVFRDVENLAKTVDIKLLGPVVTNGRGRQANVMILKTGKWQCPQNDPEDWGKKTKKMISTTVTGKAKMAPSSSLTD
ncbi:hypothetical protein G195_007440 [Phytophthora kernoviae 00238/432]|uniref:Uncharacterized protein n=1 Tax=Phytophthora kernoviae 00238/432 TaxID=1284355 RepID=A0A8J4W5H5_9STRA|nr:hypothetical protein G195_007440 [Phytophthora kernoviae 00238/432]